MISDSGTQINNLEKITMISDQIYRAYFTALLDGNRVRCTEIVQKLLDEQIGLKTLYIHLFQKSLYEVGKLWEENRISVAREHLATALTESLLTLAYPSLFKGVTTGKKVVITCATNETHQIGGKIVADYLEMKGWDSHFLGANTPIDHLLSFIDDVKPDLVGLSLSVFFNMPSLKGALASVRSEFPHMDIIVGGQAFRWGGKEIVEHYPNTAFVASLDHLDTIISNS